MNLIARRWKLVVFSIIVVGLVVQGSAGSSIVADDSVKPGFCAAPNFTNSITGSEIGTFLRLAKRFQLRACWQIVLSMGVLCASNTPAPRDTRGRASASTTRLEQCGTRPG